MSLELSSAQAQLDAEMARIQNWNDFGLYRWRDAVVPYGDAIKTGAPQLRRGGARRSFEHVSLGRVLVFSTWYKPFFAIRYGLLHIDKLRGGCAFQ